MCRHKPYLATEDGKLVVKDQYYSISEEITTFLQENGYTITGLIARSSADVFTAVKDDKEYAVVMLYQSEDKSGIYNSLVGKTIPCLAKVYLHQAVGDTTVLVEEKAIMTLEQYCHQIRDKNPIEKVSFVRGAYAWSCEADDRLNKSGLTHIDPNIGNIAIFEEDGKYQLKYIDLESLVPFTDTGYTISSFDMDMMMSILFAS